MPNLAISQLPELFSYGLTQNSEFVVAESDVIYKINQRTLNPYHTVC